VPGPCPTGGADEKADGLLARAKAVPAAAMAKARAKVGAAYEKLKERYGPGYAKAIVGAGLAGVAIPAPGASLLTAAPLIAVAELHKRLAGAFMADEPLSGLDIEELGRQFIAEVVGQEEFTEPPPKSKEPPPGPAADQVAIAGPDGKKADKLLDAAVRLGTATLGDISEAAVERLVKRPRPGQAKRLFNDDERQELADALAATLASGHLLGRSRVRERMRQLEQFGDEPPATFSRRATQFLRFADEPIQPLAPEQALDYFTRLIPELGTDPRRFGAMMERQAFTLAVATEQTLLDKVQRTISEAILTGEPGPRDVQKILDAAGVSPANPQYAEMVFRTNMMDSFNAGTTRELQDPAVQEYFPVWRYAAIVDDRSRLWHAIRNGQYYPSSVPFAEVRGEDISDVANCRCGQTPIDKFEWDKLKAAGATLEEV
jgi:hypothetical protein